MSTSTADQVRTGSQRTHCQHQTVTAAEAGQNAPEQWLHIKVINLGSLDHDAKLAGALRRTGLQRNSYCFMRMTAGYFCFGSCGETIELDAETASQLLVEVQYGL